MKHYVIECVFDGTLHYEVDAKTEEEALAEARTLFEEENDEIILNHIDRKCACFTVTGISRPENYTQDFLDDPDKMRDFITLSKEEFLASYSYLTENEYEATVKLLGEIITEISLFGKILKARKQNQ